MKRGLGIPLFINQFKYLLFIRIFASKPKAYLCALWTSCVSSAVQKAPLPRG
jgi:hypothetical protein